MGEKQKKKMLNFVAKNTLKIFSNHDKGSIEYNYG